MSVAAHNLSAGAGWRVLDVVCSHGPQDRPFEEQHAEVSIAAVTGGSFQYRTRHGRATLVPGALLLGNAGACFECGHEHGHGDRCIAFHFAPAHLEMIAADIPAVRCLEFPAPSMPPLPELLPIIADAEAARDDGATDAFEELALRVAAAALTLTRPMPGSMRQPSARDERRITAAVRRIERDAHEPLTLNALARDVGMSPYHFLRTFQRVAGMTPHQFILRTRLHRAALQLRRSDEAITTIAYAQGFNDLSTFNRRFRRLMGASPSDYRAAWAYTRGAGVSAVPTQAVCSSGTRAAD